MPHLTKLRFCPLKIGERREKSDYFDPVASKDIETNRREEINVN